MPTETNVYSRNLKVISVFFIIYWLLGLHPQENILSLGPVRFTVENPHWLPYIANGLLLYFAWRFFIHSRKKLSTSYTKFFRNDMLFQKHKFWCKKLVESARHDFFNNGKFEEYQRQNTNEFFDKLRPDQCLIKLPSLTNVNTPHQFIYEYQISLPDKMAGKPKIIKGGSFTFKFNFILKICIHLHLYALWAVSSEDAADYLIPWILFVIAIGSIFFRYDSTLSMNN